MEKLSAYINNDLPKIQTTETLATAKELFQEFPFSHVPVFDEEVYMGCLSRDDAEANASETAIDVFRYDFERFFVREKSNWLDLLDEFSKHECTLLPVLNETNQYVGYFEQNDIVKFLYETPFLKEEGGIIVVKKNFSDYSFSQISQIVESNNAKILGLFISETTMDTVEVTIKINLNDFNEILQTFRRYDYDIVSEHKEDAYLMNLKERSDYLDKYLNM